MPKRELIFQLKQELLFQLREELLYQPKGKPLFQPKGKLVIWIWNYSVYIICYCSTACNINKTSNIIIWYWTSVSFHTFERNITNSDWTEWYCWSTLRIPFKYLDKLLNNVFSLDPHVTHIGHLKLFYHIIYIMFMMMREEEYMWKYTTWWFMYGWSMAMCPLCVWTWSCM